MRQRTSIFSGYTKKRVETLTSCYLKFCGIGEGTTTESLGNAGAVLQLLQLELEITGVPR